MCAEHDQCEYVCESMCEGEHGECVHYEADEEEEEQEEEEEERDALRSKS